jgi:hypothetical protein
MDEAAVMEALHHGSLIIHAVAPGFKTYKYGRKISTTV